MHQENKKIILFKLRKKNHKKINLQKTNQKF